MRDVILKEARAAFGECIACAFFVYFGAGSVSAALSATDDIGPVEPVNYALSFGLSITLLAFAIGDTTGAHINPAVTLTLAVSGNLSPTRALLYIPAQIGGGVIGGGLLKASIGKGNYHSGIGLADDVSANQGLLLEFMGTLLLCFTVYCVAVWSAKPLENDIGGSTYAVLAPLPIGFAVLVIHLTLGPFTGCGINPARVIGAVVHHEGFWESRAGEHFWIYIVGPALAALVAPLIYFAFYGTLKPGNAGATHPHPAAAAPAQAKAVNEVRL
jgi:MIP family channel proteins